MLDSEAGKRLGSKTSTKKKQSSRANGKKGGRPKKPLFGCEIGQKGYCADIQKLKYRQTINKEKRLYYNFFYGLTEEELDPEWNKEQIVDVLSKCPYCKKDVSIKVPVSLYPEVSGFYNAVCPNCDRIYCANYQDIDEWRNRNE